MDDAIQPSCPLSLDNITSSMDMSLSKLWEMVRQGSLACCSPRILKESNMTERLNNMRKWIVTTNFFSLFHDVFKSNHYTTHLKLMQCYM